MKSRPTVGLLLSLVFLAPLPAFARWPNSADTNLPVATGPNDQFCVGVVGDQAGGAIVFWFESGSLSAQHVDRLGRLQWPANGVTLAKIPGGPLGLAMVPDRAGGAIVGWLEQESQTTVKIRLQRLMPDGSLIAADGIDLPGVGTARWFSLGMVSDGSGGAVIVWQDGDLFAQRIDGLCRPTWSEACGIPAVELRDYPLVASDGTGGVIVAWTPMPDTLPYELRAQRVDATGRIVWPTSGVVVSRSQGLSEIAAYATLLGPDGQGGSILAWSDLRGGLYAQRLDANGTPQWTEGGVLVSPGSLFAIAPDQAGGAYVGMSRHVLREDSTFSDPDLFVQHIDQDGNLAWGPGGIRVGPEGPVRVSLRVVPDDEGGMIVSWVERGGSLRAQRFDADGTLLWGSTGTMVSRLPAVALMVPDGSGGATLAWSWRVADFDVLAQHVDRKGRLGPPAPPIPGGPKPAARVRADRLLLQPPSPNPTTGRSRILFTLDAPSMVTVSVLDIAGHRVRVLLEGALDAGAHEVTLDARGLRSGLYFVRVHDGRAQSTRRVVVL